MAGFPTSEVLRRERDIWRASALAVRGARDVPPDAIAIPYGKEARPVQLIMVVLVAVEIVVVHLLVPWAWLRWTLFVLGVLSLLWVVGFVVASVVYPHTMSRQILRVRCGSILDLCIPVQNIADMRWSSIMVSHSKTATISDGVLWIHVAGTAQVSVELSTALAVELPGQPPERVERVVLPADSRDPVTRARALLDRDGSG